MHLLVFCAKLRTYSHRFGLYKIRHFDFSQSPIIHCPILGDAYTGIDLECDNNYARNIVTLKSGPNWGNSSQIAKMVADFKTAKKT
jgi:hypothetical protein